MKKTVFGFLLCLLALTFSLCLTACGENTDNKPNDTKFHSDVLTIDYENGTAFAKLSNGTNLFKFDDDITVADGASFYVCTDNLGQNVIPKTVTLNTGDNTYYLAVENGNDKKNYTITIRVKPLYTVTFDIHGGTGFESQAVEEGGFATIPTKLGYEYEWDYDFNEPITGDKTISANCKLKDEMVNFDFTSSATTCVITGIKDKTVTEIVIPDSVTSIGNSAFYGCRSLASIEIPNSVTSIGDYAFEGCHSLTSIELPDSVTSIGDGAFDCCVFLKSIKIPNSVTSIGNDTFQACSSLTSITIPDSVTSIGYGVFYCCSSLTSIAIPDSVTSIEEYAFYECKSLVSITIPNGVTSIGDNAFSNCYKLVEVINKSNLNITKGSSDNGGIGRYALNVKTSGRSEIGNISDYLFYTYDNVNYLLGYIGNETRLILPYNYRGQNYVIGNRAFECRDLLTSIAISNSVTSIGEYAFFNCISLTSITIPNSVTGIGELAFGNCSSLTDIIFNDTTTWYVTDSYDCFINKTGGEQVALTDSLTIFNNYNSKYYGYYWYKV